MDATTNKSSNPTDPSLTSDTLDSGSERDLIGGPFAVIESDPGVFTTLVRTLGVQGLQVVELYGIEPWAFDHLHPIHGLVFCFLWKKDTDVPPKKQPDGLEDGEDDSTKLWFANQLSDDACASMAILNVLLNVEGVDVGERLREFRNETERMSSPVCRAFIFSFGDLNSDLQMKGLAVSNAHFIRQSHNTLARYAVPRHQVQSSSEPELPQTCRHTRSNKRPRNQDP